jgi:hypothetical protein
MGLHIFRHIFLSNYWWQRSDIWSQASYRYPISWEMFLDPSDSYFLIKINKIGKQEVGIWWAQKRFPRYGVPIWSLWPNIRFLPSIVAEKNALYPRSPKGEGGIPFYLCPSFRPSKIFFVAFFSVNVDGRNLTFGHKRHIPGFANVIPARFVFAVLLD